ncbi:HAD family phosphatase [Aureibaculum sp. 2210JD6-5]|uniref:HAD family hydrolase n=1 Tax=Aureibaculum sp. 2210JD6-5 TaxID=3103957 RepID=UPI002AAE8853|nr:HAD family phosphatase [Aureibaculum sp. 2210JD6-5]MDY7393829.1 HAD family phosphatase [Aureibaculum sp. 2210JD6-5]
MNKIDTIIFDLGGVLIDWNPKYVYREVFNGDEEKVDWFLNEICTMEWNMEHDAGRLLKDGTELLVKQYPQYEEWIRIYYNRWADMLGGPIEDTVALLNKLKEDNIYNLYALTNWSAELFPVALERYDFLQHFQDIVVSGTEKTRKPFAKIYEIILERNAIIPKRAVFIDDNRDNVEAAKRLGIHGLHFKSARQLKAELINLGIQV